MVSDHCAPGLPMCHLKAKKPSISAALNSASLPAKQEAGAGLLLSTCLFFRKKNAEPAEFTQLTFPALQISLRKLNETEDSEARKAVRMKSSLLHQNRISLEAIASKLPEPAPSVPGVFGKF